MGPSYFILALLIPLLLLLPCLLVLLPFGHRRERAVGFFHPYANDGGGGERVLWCAVRAVQEGLPELNCVIYSGDDATPTSLAERAWERFGVQLPVAPSVVRLHKRWWVEAETYPHFTLLGQSLGSLVLAWEALTKLTPMLFFDTSGYAFSYPLARAFGCKVACYTHYPTINSDMLARVVGRTSMYNNNAQIAGSFILSVGKTFYYRLMAWIYGKVGRCVHLAMVNSSWTQLHIENLWKIPDRIVRVYPPCNTVSLQALSLKRHADNTFIISVAQFRPEKAHVLQLEAFAAVLNQLDVNSILYKNYKAGKLRLKLVGSCRHKEDELRVKMLKRKCSELGIEEHVDFLVNVTYTELRELLGGAIAGIHSMTDEHFGIVVVEYMAAGVIPIAHNSAGPKMDIVLDEEGQKIGFLAITVDQYADAMYKVLTMTEEQRLQMAAAARQHSSCFSEGKFDQDFKIAMAPIFLHLKERAGLVHSK